MIHTPISPKRTLVVSINSEDPSIHSYYQQKIDCLKQRYLMHQDGTFYYEAIYVIHASSWQNLNLDTLQGKTIDLFCFQGSLPLLPSSIRIQRVFGMYQFLSCELYNQFAACVDKKFIVETTDTSLMSHQNILVRPVFFYPEPETWFELSLKVISKELNLPLLPYPNTKPSNLFQTIISWIQRIVRRSLC